MHRHLMHMGLTLGLLLGAFGSALGQDRPVPGVNPLRGDSRVIEAGRQGYRQHCAECHGEEAVNPIAEAPDLRRLDSFCRRLKDPALQTRLQQALNAMNGKQSAMAAAQQKLRQLAYGG